MNKLEERYRGSLAAIPEPGTGCHTKLLGVATLGILAGQSKEVIFSDIRAAIPHGARHVPDSEINDAIKRASIDTTPGNGNAPFQRPMPLPCKSKEERIADLLKQPSVSEAVFRQILEAGGGEHDPFGADMWESSPIRIDARSEKFPYSGDMLLLLDSLYKPDDLLFIGSTYDAGEGHIKPAVEWRNFFQSELKEIESCDSASRQKELITRLAKQYPLFLTNPLTGKQAKKKTGDDLTLRGDSCVKEFRYFVAECDNMPFPQQGALLRGLCSVLDFRIAAIVYSGGKSCHAWICCDGVDSLSDWEQEIKQGCFSLLAAIGFDRACANASHLSRLPGIYRPDKRDWQRLLYLAPKGGAL